jgi:hypothetical protein
MPLGSRTTWRAFIFVATVVAAYLSLSFVLIGFRTDQLALITIFGTLYLASSTTRKFISGFAIFIVFWILFDYMKAFPNYLFNDVHIKSLYDAEIHFFGIQQEDAWLTPNEYLKEHSFALADVLAGIFYLCWIPVPLGFAAFLYFKDRRQFIHFSLTFLLVNLLGFIVYYIYPAAPPWYVQQYGFDFHSATPGNTAGLTRFDHFFNVTVFQQLYSKSSNVFAAMPSLHSAYPLIVTYFGLRNKLGWVNILFVIISVGIWMAAVYTSHHYVLDVLAGIAIAGIGITLFFILLKRSNTFQRFINRYVMMIS